MAISKLLAKFAGCCFRVAYRLDLISNLVLPIASAKGRLYSTNDGTGRRRPL